MNLETSNTLKKVRDFAANAHRGQSRKYSTEQYIMHPVRVMNLLIPYTDKEEILSAALLHDVLEDTKVKKEELQGFLMGVMEEEQVQLTVNLVIELTDIYVKVSYPSWNRRKRKQMELKRLVTTSAASQTIRYADIIDNCDRLVEADREFADTFLNECLTLLLKLQKGDAQLYRKALQTVKSGLALLKDFQKRP